jgi:glycosyltransferase involved in cell wall biosynthesis
MALGPLTCWGVRHWLATRPWLQPLKPAYRAVKHRLVLPVLWPLVRPLWQVLERTGLAAAVAALARLIGMVILLNLWAVRCLAWAVCAPVTGVVRGWEAAVAGWHCAWLYWRGGRHIATASPRGRKVVMLVCSHLPIDPRVEREARALAAAGFAVKILCPAWERPEPPPHWGPGVALRILPHKAGHFASRFPYVLGRELLRAAREEQDVLAYHAHDLNTAMPALLAAAHKGVPCVCDFHEWFSENVTYHARRKAYEPHPFAKRWIYRALERVVMHTATSVITVCDSIAELLDRQYQAPRPTRVIRNIPHLDPTATAARSGARHLRQQLGLRADQQVLLYQGGVGPSRRLEPVIQAMAWVRHAVLVIRGPAIERFAGEYVRLAAAAGCRDRVFCLPAVFSADVVREARAADLGIYTVLATAGLSFRLALPNKVFEYLAAGLPILVADLPEVRKLVDTYQVGLCFDPEDPRSIARAINRLAGDAAFRQSCRANIGPALEDLRADREWDKLVQLYQQLDGRAPVAADEPLVPQEVA